MIAAPVRGAIRAFGTLAPWAAATWFSRQCMVPRPAPSLPLPEPSAPHRDRSVTHEGDTLWWSEWGEGPTVLLVHGWGGRSGSFHAMVDPLVGQGFRVVAPDLHAHGRSGGKRTSMPQCAAGLRKVVDAVGPIHAAVGHSFGSPTTVFTLLGGVHVERLVLMAPVLSIHGALGGMAREIGLPETVFEKVSRDFAVRFQLHWPDLDTDRMVSRLDVPVLVVHDEGDRVTPWSQGAAVARAARRGRILTTAGLGHRAVLADPGVVREVGEFLRAGRGGRG